MRTKQDYIKRRWTLLQGITGFDVVADIGDYPIVLDNVTEDIGRHIVNLHNRLLDERAAKKDG